MYVLRSVQKWQTKWTHVQVPKTHTNVGMSYVWTEEPMCRRERERREKRRKPSENFFIEIGSREGVNIARIIIKLLRQIVLVTQWAAMCLRQYFHLHTHTHTRRGVIITRLHSIPCDCTDTHSSSELPWLNLFQNFCLSVLCARFSLPPPPPPPPSPLPIHVMNATRISFNSRFSDRTVWLTVLKIQWWIVSGDCFVYRNPLIWWMLLITPGEENIIFRLRLYGLRQTDTHLSVPSLSTFSTFS